MKIKFTTIPPPSEPIILTLKNDSIIKNIKIQLEKPTCNLLFNGISLENDRNLQYYNIKENDLIYFFSDDVDTDVVADDGPNCAICFEKLLMWGNWLPAMFSETVVITLPCQHLFHRTCIQNQANNQNQCPICKTIILRTMPTKEYLKAQSEGVNQIAISLQQQQRDQQNHGPDIEVFPGQSHSLGTNANNVHEVGRILTSMWVNYDDHELLYLFIEWRGFRRLEGTWETYQQLKDGECEESIEHWRSRHNVGSTPKKRHDDANCFENPGPPFSGLKRQPRSVDLDWQPPIQGRRLLFGEENEREERMETEASEEVVEEEETANELGMANEIGEQIPDTQQPQQQEQQQNEDQNIKWGVTRENKPCIILPSAIPGQYYRFIKKEGYTYCCAGCRNLKKKNKNAGGRVPTFQLTHKQVLGDHFCQPMSI